MRYSKEELIELRKAVLKSEALVTRKIKRMAKGDNGIDITGMEYDPRVGKDAISRMSGDRLKRLLEKQSYFRRAHVGYYKGARGTIVTRQAYRNYANSVRKINTTIEAEQHKYDDVYIKPLGMTVKERRAMMTPAHPVHDTEAYDGMKKLKIYSPQQLMGTEGAKMIALRNDDIRRQYSSRVLVAKARGYMNEMMDMVGDEAARAKFNSLSDEQFWFIWAYTDFPEELSLKYLAMQLSMMVESGDKEMSQEMVDSAMERGEQSLGRAMEYYNYAKALEL
nr:MAG TPA: hypothetical protein [Caudoviricetes sp.]